MQQVLVKKGDIIIEDVPPPALGDNEVLIQTHYSLISTGTELSGIISSGQSLLTRALAQPHNVKKALKMASEKGVIKTYKIIKGMLDFGTPTGYSLAGEIIAVGKNVTDLAIGDHVAASGAGQANHAEVVAVPRLLVSRIPDNLSTREASSVTLGAIALQGVRQTQPKLGEYVAVIGLGLIGQLTCQILRAAGVHVIGIDIDPARIEKAAAYGCEKAFLPEEAMRHVASLTDGYGVDATIITAATSSNDPLRQAVTFTRRKGTVVVVGAVGLTIERSPWYEKEIDLKISCSYGPGRYDPTYEDHMIDYPLPYVRWTENRNMEEYLKLLAEGKINFSVLDAQEYDFSQAAEAYAFLKQEKPLAVLLSYQREKKEFNKKIAVTSHTKKEGRIGIAVIGAGAFVTTTHLPNLEKLRSLFDLRAVVSKKGTTAKQFAKRYEAAYCTTDYHEVLSDDSVDAVLIGTRHDLHARLTLEALKAGKAVFVEKPLAVSADELKEIENFMHHAKNPPLLFVGFNRRFSPYAREIAKRTAARRSPLQIYYRVNAGYLPPEHWTQTAEGGGRIIGEACHFFDLFQFWTGSQPKETSAYGISPKTPSASGRDNFSATIKYADGSVCTLLYTALGPKELAKEYAEVYCDGIAHILDDYKQLSVKGGRGGFKTLTQDKGHLAELEAFGKALKTGEPPIAINDVFAVTELSFKINEMVTNPH